VPGYPGRDQKRGRILTVLRTGLIRYAVAGALTVLPLAATVGYAADSASASPATFVGIKCKVLSGNTATTVTLKTCNGNTGGASIAEPISTLTSGGTVTWLNSQTTTFDSPTLTTIAQTSSLYTCKKTAAYSEIKATGAVLADTTGSAPVPGSYTIWVCLNSTSGKITLAPKTPGSTVLKPAKIG
jgi:hypothetical protein